MLSTMIYTRILLIALLSIHNQAPAMELLSKAVAWLDDLHRTPEDSSDSDAEAAPEPKDPFSDFLLPGQSREYKNELWKLCLNCSAYNKKETIEKVTALIKTGLHDINDRKDDYKNENLLHITGPITKLTQILVEAGADTNAQDKDGNTPLHNACKLGYQAVIPIFLQHPTINVNIKNNDGDCPIFCILESNFKSSEERRTIANLLIDSKKVDLNKKNKNKKTFFYRLVSLWSDENYKKFPLNFITQFSEQERKTFATQELHHAATMYSSEPERVFNKFMERCLELGADINHRNYKGQRPMEVAAEQYMYATKCLSEDNKSFQAKQNIYYSFLKKTAYVYDQEIRERLKQNGLIDDFVKKIMGYYTALITVDRICALQSNWDVSFPHFSRKDKKEILNKICNNLGYTNPMIKKQPLDFPKIMN